VKTAWLTLICTCALAASAGAQEVRVGMRVGDPPIGYDSGGRRDPFVSLVMPRRPTPAQAAAIERPRTGLGALSLADTVVRGIVRHGDEMMAIVEGANNQSYVLHVKDRLFDAEVRSIDERGVVFVERIEGAKLESPRVVRKTLRSGAEVVR
jgi:hypothetical protein